VYIRHLEEATANGHPQVLRLADPPPDGGARSAESGWWPPAMLSPQWIRANHDAFDLMHVHFGFDTADSALMEDLVAELRQHNKPLVYTVHDLVNPHQPDPAAHNRLLDVLVPHADKLITLTAGAAREIHDRWGVEAQVLPHPHVVDFASMDRLRAERRLRAVDPVQCGPQRIGVHLKGLRHNIDPGILDPLSRVVGRLPDVVLQVNIHAQPLDRNHPEFRPDLAHKLQTGAAEGLWELESHNYFSEPELFSYLASLDVNVLPYRFGTHSGWLEAALDVGTHVTVPDCGYYAEQDASITQFRLTKDGADEDSLERALLILLARKDLAGPEVSGRRSERNHLAKTHHEIYRALLDRF
ncbi:MAG: glycosyltransferase family 4 protein, partial [Micrococcaceae bacterium]|nr:glycosyltransferase family 4 protein [Micrococcaceae bacterium]